MPESAVQLKRKVKLFVPDGDITAQQHFRCRLTAHTPVAAAVRQINKSVAVQVLNLIHPLARRGRRQTRAMRQIEHTQRITRYLVHHIRVAAVQTRAVDRRNRRISRSRQILVLVITVQRKQLVLLPRQVNSDIQPPVLCLDCRQTKTDLHTLVLHLAEVRQHLVVDKRRNRHRVVIQHIVDIRVVIIRGKDHPVLPESPLHPHIRRLRLLPRQVRVLVPRDTQYHIRQTFRLRDTGRRHQPQRLISRDTSQVTGQTPAGAYIQPRQPFFVPQPRLFLHVPSDVGGREETPFMPFRGYRTGIPSGRDSDRIAVQSRITHTPHDGSHPLLLITAAAAVPQTQCTHGYIVVTVRIGRQAVDRCVKTRQRPTL